MVFNRRPDEFFMDVTQNGLEILKTSISTVTEVIRSGDSGLRSLDDALTGNRPKFQEPPSETFVGVLDMLNATLQEAQDKHSTQDAEVIQHSRDIMRRISEAESGYRNYPTGQRTVNDIFRLGLRQLRMSTSLVRLASGQGTAVDLQELARWADNLNQQIEQFKAQNDQAVPAPVQLPPAEAPQLPAAAPPTAEAAPSTTPSVKPAKRPKRAAKIKQPPSQEDIVFARAVAAEMNDDKVNGWLEDFCSGKITEAQWISRLTAHASKTRDTLDDVFGRANERVAREQNGG